jgi:hypothetical protein
MLEQNHLPPNIPVHEISLIITNMMSPFVPERVQKRNRRMPFAPKKGPARVISSAEAFGEGGQVSVKPAFAGRQAESKPRIRRLNLVHIYTKSVRICTIDFKRTA